MNSNLLLIIARCVGVLVPISCHNRVISILLRADQYLRASINYRFIKIMVGFEFHARILSRRYALLYSVPHSVNLRTF